MKKKSMSNTRINSLLIALILSGLMLLQFSCAPNVNVRMTYNNSDHLNYRLPNTHGYYFQESGNLFILLQFEKGPFFCITDTGEWLNIYLTKKNIEMAGSNNKAIKNAFFLNVQMRETYGALTVEDLNIDKKNDHTIMVSGRLTSEAVAPERRDIKKASFSFQNIKAERLKTKQELQDKDIPYAQEGLKNHFPEWIE